MIRNALILSLSLFSSAVLAAGPVKIEPQFPEGRVSLVKTEQNNVTDAAGMRIVQVHVQEIQEEVLESRKGAARIQLTYMRQAMRTESPMGSMNFDSAVEGSAALDPSFAMLSGIVGQSFQVWLERDLSVREIQGSERLIQRIRESAPENLPAGALEAVEATFKPDALAKMVNQKNDMFP